METACHALLKHRQRPFMQEISIIFKKTSKSAQDFQQNGVSTSEASMP